METPSSNDAANSGWMSVDWIDRSLLTVILGSITVIIAATFMQLSFGTLHVPIPKVFSILTNPRILTSQQVWEAFLFGHDYPVWMSTEALVVWNGRLPRVIVGILVGMDLAIAGAIFQAVTRNELASPYILGVSSGAGLIIILTLMFVPFLMPVMPILAAVGGGIAFLIVYAIAWKEGGTDPTRLILAGVIVGAVFGSIQSGLFFFIDDLGTVMAVSTWMAGSLLGMDWEQIRIALPFTLLAVCLGLIISRQLNVLLLGEQTAQSLGMPVERVRFMAAGIAILATGAAVAVSGLIGFIGLVIPHMVRGIVGSDYKRLLVGSIFLGPAILVGADVGARLLLSPTQLPVGIITGILGGPYFLYLLRKHDNMGEI